LAEEPVEQRSATEAQKTEREIYFTAPEAGYRSCPVYDRYKLSPGATVCGPCVIEEREATVVVPPDCTVDVDGYRNLLITLGTEEST
jgi:N-methylhydantoinase A